MAKVKFRQADEDEFLNQVYTDATLTGTGTASDPLHVEAGGGGSSDWGNIGGTLSDQTDLQSALDLKADISTIAELSQDAVGAMVDTTLVYTDGTPLLSRAAISGDITMSAGSNTAAITAGAIVDADVNASAAITLSKLATGALPTAITIASANIVDGTIVDADINASAAIDATKIANGTVTNTEFQYINTLTSNAQTQLDGKQATLTGLTASVTELNYTDGVTSAIQTQLNAKVNTTGNETIAGIKTFSSIPLLPGSDPTTANQATRKAYVDAIGQMVDPSLYKNACMVATTANITLSGEQTIDTFATSATRVLVWKQTAPAENGIYISNAGAWTRASDYNTAAEVIQGTSTFVLDGSENKNRLFVMNEATVSTLGTDPIGFTPLSGLGEYNAGTGLDLSGNTFSVATDYVEDKVAEFVLNGQSYAPSSAVQLYLEPTQDALGADLLLGNLTLRTSEPLGNLIMTDLGTDYQVAFSDYIDFHDLTSYTGTIAADSIVSFSNTSGVLKDSGVKITGSDPKIIQPVTAGVGLTIQASTASSGNGDVTTIKGGDGLQSGFTIGGNLTLQGGLGYGSGGTKVTPYITISGADFSASTANNVIVGLKNSASRFQIFNDYSGLTGRLSITGTGNSNVTWTPSNTGTIRALKQTLSSVSGAATIDTLLGDVFMLSATGDVTLSISGGGVDGESGRIAFYASGANRTLTLTTGFFGFRFTGAVPSLSVTTSGSTDYIYYVFNSITSTFDIVQYTKDASSNPTVQFPQPTDVQVFTYSGTWTKPAGSPKMTQVIAIGGGAGGASGAKRAAGVLALGGGGGGGGGYAISDFVTSTLGSTETVTIGAGGPGGASVSANTTAGTSGTAGGSTFFGDWLRAGGGNPGVSSGGGVGGGIANPFSIGNGIQGGAASGSGAAGAVSSQSSYHPTGGGAGGGITTGNVASAGGAAGRVGLGTLAGTGSGSAKSSITGGTSGAVSTGGGNGTASPTNSGIGGSGGGGGGSSTSTNAGAGGDGAYPGGGGGGGGGARNDVGNSGAGGDGGGGWLVAITTY